KKILDLAPLASFAGIFGFFVRPRKFLRGILTDARKAVARCEPENIFACRHGETWRFSETSSGELGRRAPKKRRITNHARRCSQPKNAVRLCCHIVISICARFANKARGTICREAI